MPGQEYQQTRSWIDEQIMLYVNYVGACERIYKTPIPIAFTVSLTFLLFFGGCFWLIITCPCMWNDCTYKAQW